MDSDLPRADDIAGSRIDFIDRSYQQMLRGELTPENFASDYLGCIKALDALGVAADPDISPFIRYFGRLSQVYLPRIDQIDNLRKEIYRQVQENKYTGEYVQALENEVRMCRLIGMDKEDEIDKLLSQVEQEVKEHQQRQIYEGHKTHQLIPAEKRELGFQVKVGWETSGKYGWEENEDSVSFSDEDGYAGIFDGVGGSAAGRWASQKAAEIVKDKLQGQFPIDHIQARRLLGEVLIETSDLLYQEGHDRGQTTAVICKLGLNPRTNTRFVAIASMGDSRAYLYRDGRIVQLTEDDNIVSNSQTLTIEQKRQINQKLDDVASLKDFNKFTEADHDAFEYRNHIYKCLGHEKADTPNLYSYKIQKGDKIILTTDGVHDNLTRAEIEMIVKKGGDIWKKLKEEALERSKEKNHVRAKPDDITALVMEIL